MELGGEGSGESSTKVGTKPEPQDPKQSLQTLLQRQAKFLEQCTEVKVSKIMVLKYICIYFYLYLAYLGEGSVSLPEMATCFCFEFIGSFLGLFHSNIFVS